MDYQATSCACMAQEIMQPPLSMAYVPVQMWDCVYDSCAYSLSRGTIFPSLDKPFLEGACPNV